MRDRVPRAIAPAIFLAMASVSAVEAGDGRPAPPPRKVLVELYTSQGNSSCPPASDLLGRLGKLGYGPDRVVALNFHVDDPDSPWADPFSDPAYGRRQREYDRLLRRDDLAFTPLMVVDGRHPLIGPDRTRAVSALGRAVEVPAGLELGLVLDGSATRKALRVTLAARETSAAGRDLLIGVALAEDPVTTRVLAGENAGRTLAEHQVVRRFDRKVVRLDRATARNLDFRLELPSGANPSRFRVAAFAQDVETGVVHQADAIPWVETRVDDRDRDPKTAPARRKLRRPTFVLMPSFPGFDVGSSSTTSPNPFEDESSGNCPVCGSPIVVPPLFMTRAQAAALLRSTNTC